MDGDDRWITATAAAEISGYSIDYLYRLLGKGKIAGRKFSNAWQVDRVSLDEYLANANERKQVDKRYRWSS